MKSGASPSGLTLAEAVVAIFVLLAGVVVMTRLFHTGLRYQTLVDNRSIATMLAERQMEKIRGWSRFVHKCPGGTQPFTDWTGCPGAGAPFSDPEFTAFQITVTAIAHNLFSPCSLFENLYAPAEQRKISASVRKVSIKVQWGATLNQQHNLVSLVAIPTGEPASPNPVTVTISGSTTLSRDDSRPFSASATNSQGQALPDLFYNYIIQPGTGNTGGGFGSAAPDRDGRACVVRHCIYDVAAPVPNITGYGVGICTVRALARYRGRPIEGSSSQLDMRP